MERDVIDSSLVDGHALLTGNFDGNDQDVIIAGYRGRGASVNIYRNDGKQWVKSRSMKAEWRRRDARWAI